MMGSTELILFVTSTVGLLVLWVVLRGLAGLLWRLFRRTPPPPPRRGKPIVVDGSNVMHWTDTGTPAIDAVVLVLRDLQGRGYAPIVHFDANVGYKIGQRHMNASALGPLLPVPVTDIRVAPARTPADPLLIADALALGAPIVSNDRFMDWRGDFPALRDKGRLVKGRVRGRGVDLHW